MAFFCSYYRTTSIKTLQTTLPKSLSGMTFPWRRLLKTNVHIAEPGHQNSHHRSEIAPHGLTSTTIIHSS